LTTAGAFTIIRDDCSHRASFGGFDIPVNKFVLHTVEGGAGKCGIDGATSVLKRSTYFPHFIIGRDCNNHVRIKQLIPTTLSGRALKSPGNRLGALQVFLRTFSKIRTTTTTNRPNTDNNTGRDLRLRVEAFHA
jgi:hypothetical protein